LRPLFIGDVDEGDSLDWHTAYVRPGIRSARTGSATTIRQERSSAIGHTEQPR
jgi:hypothetical protein